MAKADPLKGRKILYLVSEDWYFWSHRLPFARAARDAGAEVHVACRYTDHRDRIVAEGFLPHALPFDRSGLNPVSDLLLLLRIRALYRRVEPDIVHHVALKPVLYGSVAAWMSGVPHVVNAMTGLGFLFTNQARAACLLRPVVSRALRWLNNRPNTTLILQNDDDRAVFASDIGVDPARLAVIRGSGVDTDAFAPMSELEGPEPEGPVVAVCVSRMLWDKGIGEVVGAARILKDRGVDMTVRLVGARDPVNPLGIPDETLAAWAREGVVEVAGPSDDIPAVYRATHIAVLPSYREGLPKSLLEGAACGRPVVATDVAGCREICVDGESGIRVPLKSVKPLADALQKLAEDGDLRRRLGAGARRLVETAFAEEIVVDETLALYRKKLG